MNSKSDIYLRGKSLYFFYNQGLVLVVILILLFSSNCFALAWESSKDAKSFEEGNLAGIKRVLEKKNYIKNSPEFIPGALRTVIETGNIEVIRYLKKRGWLKYCHIKKNCKPIIYSTIYRNISLIKYFLSEGFDINEKDRFGTALHSSIAIYDYDTTKVLIENGIDVTKKNAKGETALELAIERYQRGIYKNKAPDDIEKYIAYLRSKEPNFKNNNDKKNTKKKSLLGWFLELFK